MDEDENQIIALRKKRRAELIERGIDPYPYSYKPTHTAEEVQSNFWNLEKGEKTEDEVTVAGRIMRINKMGKARFYDLVDISGRIQIYTKKEKLDEKESDILSRLDVGDIIGIKGSVFKTRSGETTINTKRIDILSKSIRPFPGKWYGLKDKNIRYRNRSLDLIVNSHTKETFQKRTKAVDAMRRFLNERNYMEVEIPLLQPVYGGGDARPFITHLNALDSDYFLSISPEMYLKRIIIGGFEKAYTICKNFRNEGIDRTHNPEFTMMECYEIWSDYHDMMKLTEEMYAFIFSEVIGVTKAKYLNTEIDYTPPWRRASMLDLVAEHSGFDVGSMDEDELRELLKIKKLTDGFYVKNIPLELVDDWSWGEIVQEMFEFYSEKRLIQPTIVMDHPKESSPLCKICRNDSRLIERFEPFIYSYEIGNAYSEMNDPVVQRKLLGDQISSRKESKYMMDKDYCEAMEYGMPPTGGLGLGVDRLVMLLTNSETIKDVIFFPFMR